MTTTAPAPYIAKSAHKGHWNQILDHFRSSAFTAGELAAMAGKELPGLATGEIVLWEQGGVMPGGGSMFYRTRFVPQTDGSLAVYDANGRLIIIHPADRVIRILVK